MNRKLGLLRVVPILLLAGCAGSSHATSGAGTTGTRSAATHSTPAPATTTATSGQTGGVTTSTSTATGSLSTTTATKPLPPPSHVRLPATFTLTAAGTLNPPVIAVPAGLPVQLTVVSQSASPQVVVLATKPARTIKVPAHGKASVLLKRVPKGTYKVEIGGEPKGSLSIGVQVGP